MNSTEEIKSRIDIVDLVSEYVPIKQSGTNWKGLCPFHREKTPSFMVSKERQIFKCFGCNEGGDVFSFLMKMEGLEFPEALKILAQKAGVKLENYNPELSSKRNTLLDIILLTVKLWHHLLMESAKGKHAREYLKKRGVVEETIVEFKLGYAPDSWDETSSFLQKRGFKEDDIFTAGLTVKKERGSGFYDRFRNRLIFPIFDIHGNPIAFGARDLESTHSSSPIHPEKNIAKYINSPQTPIYNKSAVLYNLSNAKQYIKHVGYTLVVEGYMDVLAVWKAGFHNVIATSGTAFTEQQIKILKRYSDNLVLCFDSDPAGQSAADRGIDLALRADMNIKVVPLPEGKDPDDLIQKDLSAFKKAVETARSIMEYYFEKTLTAHPNTSPENQKIIKDTLLTPISKLSDVIIQSYWLKKLAALFEAPEHLLREELSRKYSGRSYREPEEGVIKKDRRNLLEERLLALAFKHPDYISHIIEHLDQSVFFYKTYGDLYKSLIIYYTKNQDTSAEKSFEIAPFRQNVSDDFRLMIDSLILLAEKDFLDFGEKELHYEIHKTISELKSEYFNARLSQLVKELKEAEDRGDQDVIEKLSAEVSKICSEKNLLEESKI